MFTFHVKERAYGIALHLDTDFVVLYGDTQRLQQLYIKFNHVSMFPSRERRSLVAKTSTCTIPLTNFINITPSFTQTSS